MKDRGGSLSETRRPPFPMPELLWRLLQARGFSEEKDLNSLFAPSLKALSDPFKLQGMTEAVTRLRTAFLKDEKICIYGDFDLDGSCAVALLKDGFERLGFSEIQIYQPNRLSEGYGVHVSAIEKLKSESVNLVVTVDVGITSFEAADKAAELGLDLIITDHHLPNEQIPKACAVVDPNQASCESDLGYLCGAGVAFFLILALKQDFLRSGIHFKDFSPKDLLDLFALATIGDMVPLKGFNRPLVRHGLVQLAKTERPGLRVLLEQLDLFGRLVKSQDVAFSIAPGLNALSRIESESLPINVLDCSKENAEEVVVHLMKSNNKRKKLQSDAKNSAIERLGEDGVAQDFIWVWDKSFHKGVVGLVATHFCNTYGKPSFVGYLDDEGMIHGSARAPDGDLDLTQALSSASASLEQFGGHARAAGFRLKEENAKGFAEALEDYMSQGGFSFEVRTEYDCPAKIAEFNPALLNWLEKLEPFGMGFSYPKFLLESVRIVDIRKLNGGHLSFQLDQDGGRLRAVCFSPKEEIARLKSGKSADLVVEPSWNEFQGRKSVQLLVRGLVP